ncbi:hypothetical protein H0266_11000 [Halobacillus locisalis]|uniref:Uncharacterized protein n=1 Tax=Halobacillus locisalis TaxID=220753 RepID=A0A838CTE9_9BACI|nr:hypothetical protein [Halobacillus locisalis]MBA2175422.1 hypothetical protein [Halobacillus locisalis]
MVIFCVIAVVLAFAMMFDRNKRVNKLEEQIEYNERRTKAFDEVTRYNNMN